MASHWFEGDVRIFVGSLLHTALRGTMSEIDLDGTVVAITGAGVGLGRSMSVALAMAGARVVLAAPELELLETVAAEIKAKAGAGRALPVVARHHRACRLRACACR